MAEISGDLQTTFGGRGIFSTSPVRGPGRRIGSSNTQLQIDLPTGGVCNYLSGGVFISELIAGQLPAVIFNTDASTSISLGQVKLDHTRYNWVVFLIIGTGRLFACPEYQWAAVATGQDVVGLLYSVPSIHQRWQPRGVQVKTVGDYGFTNIFSDAQYSSASFSELFQYGQSSSYTSYDLILASSSVTYPGNIGGRLGNGNTIGVSLNQITGNGAGTVLLGTPEGLHALAPPDGSGTVTDILTNIPIQDGSCTHFGVDGVAYGPGNVWWVLYNEWQPDTVPDTHGWGALSGNTGNVLSSQYVMSSPDLITWTVQRTVFHGAGEDQDTVAIGIGPGGAVLLADTYMPQVLGGGSGATENLTNWRYALGSSTPVTLPTYTGLQSAMLRSYLLIGLRSEGYWVGDRYNIPMVAGFGGGENPPFVALFGGSSSSGGLNGYIVDANGNMDTGHHFIAAAANGNADLIWAIDASTGDLIYRPGPLGTTWTTLASSFVAVNDLIVLFQWSIRNPGTLICIHGQLGAAVISTWDGSTATAGTPFALAINDFNDFQNTTTGAFWEAEITQGAEG